MKTTNVEPLIEAIKNIEEQDLIAALKAHDGSYEFKEDDEHLLPPVEFYEDFKGPKAGDVLSARLVPNPEDPEDIIESVELTINDEDGETYDIDADALYPGMMSGITHAIPEPEK